MRILINGLSMGSGGGLSVGRELAFGIAHARPEWHIDFLIIRDFPLHAELLELPKPSNLHFHQAPHDTLGRGTRSRYENGPLCEWVKRDQHDVALQLNGMVVRNMPIPTVCHFQDPWPYRPQAWTSHKERAIAWIKRRVHRRSLKSAAAATWTSTYLQQLITSHHGHAPAINEVIHNGVPDEWIDRSEDLVSPAADRPRTLITVSNVSHYKRQWLVVEALGILKSRGGYDDVRYHILGSCADDVRRDIESRAKRLSLENNVVVEGRVSDTRVESMMAESRGFVLMSVCESFGLPAIEAMTFGTPVVVADCCAIPEICGEAALLVPEDDAESLAQKLACVLDDRGTVSTLATKGRDNARRFRWTDASVKMADVLHQCVAD